MRQLRQKNAYLAIGCHNSPKVKYQKKKQKSIETSGKRKDIKGKYEQFPSISTTSRFSQNFPSFFRRNSKKLLATFERATWDKEIKPWRV